MTVFATAGKPDSFGKLRYPQDLPEYLGKFGLNGFEIQCGRGFNVSSDACDFFAGQSQISLSVHSPYFISISSVDEDKRAKSVDYILETARLAKRVGAKRIVVHSGSCAKISREQALALALDTLMKARTELDAAGLDDIIICPETMGKINQLGDLDEVLELCGFDERMLPCVDFGHLNARSHGNMNVKSVLDRLKDKLGAQRLKHLHIHFSKIEFTVGGEKKHLTFSDSVYGPDYKPLIEEIVKRGLEPFIVCESDGTQAEDCQEMRKYYYSCNAARKELF